MGGVALKYDPALRLYEISGAAVTRFAYDGTDLIAEYDGAGTLLRRYVHGPGSDEPLVWYEGSSLTNRRWYHADERGSVIATSDAAGAAIAINSYDDHGIPGLANQGRFGYTGQTFLGDLGMNYYKARMYSPTMGRFMQTDPIGYGDGLNMYAYVGGDPVNKVDPSGLCGYSRGVPCNYTDSAGNQYRYYEISSLNEKGDVISTKAGYGWTGNDGSFLSSFSWLQSSGFYTPGIPSGPGGMDGAPPPPESGKSKSPCDQAMEESGMVETESLNYTAIVGGGITGSWGAFHNTRTGTTGNYFSLGGGAGVDVGPSVTGGQYSSAGNLSGGAVNLSATMVALTGSISWNLNNMDFTGGAFGIAPPSKALSVTLTGTKLYGCKIGG